MSTDISLVKNDLMDAGFLTAKDFEKNVIVSANRAGFVRKGRRLTVLFENSSNNSGLQRYWQSCRFT
jgi:hypothetical protein